MATASRNISDSIKKSKNEEIPSSLDLSETVAENTMKLRSNTASAGVKRKLETAANSVVQSKKVNA